LAYKLRNIKHASAAKVQELLLLVNENLNTSSLLKLLNEIEPNVLVKSIKKLSASNKTPSWLARNTAELILTNKLKISHEDKNKDYQYSLKLLQLVKNSKTLLSPQEDLSLANLLRDQWYLTQRQDLEISLSALNHAELARDKSQSIILQLNIQESEKVAQEIIHDKALDLIEIIHLENIDSNGNELINSDNHDSKEIIEQLKILITNTDWLVNKGAAYLKGHTILLGNGSTKAVPENVAKQWKIIQEAEIEKFSYSIALNQIMVIALEAAANNHGSRKVLTHYYYENALQNIKQDLAEKKILAASVSDPITEPELNEEIRNNKLIIALVKEIKCYLIHLEREIKKEPNRDGKKYSENFKTLQVKYNHIKKLHFIISEGKTDSGILPTAFRITEAKKYLQNKTVRKELSKRRGYSFLDSIMKLFGIETTGNKFVGFFNKKIQNHENPETHDKNQKLRFLKPKL
jgi:hypothetical protein